MKRYWIINLLLVLAIILIILNFIFRNEPELLSGLGFIFDVIILNISLAYISGYIIWFLTFLLPNKEAEKERILRRNILISYYIENFWNYAKNITFPDIPKEKWSLSLDEVELKQNFDFTRLKSIFTPSLSLFDWAEPAFKLYFENQNKFLELIKNILLNDDIKHFPEYEELLLDYIKNIEPNNPYKSINNSYIMFQNARNSKQLKDIYDFLDLKIIKEHKWPVEYLYSNIKNNYIRLYQMINYNIDFIGKYESIIKNINQNGK